MDFVRIGRIGVGTIASGEAMRVEVDRVDDYYLLMFCLRGHSRTLADNSLFDADRRNGTISGPGSPFVADLSDDCEQFVMRIDREAMHAHTGHRHIRLRPALDLDTPATRPWFEQVKMLTRSPAPVEAAQRSELVSTDIVTLRLSISLRVGQAWEPGNDPVPMGARLRLAAFTARRATCRQTSHFRCARPISPPRRGCLCARCTTRSGDFAATARCRLRELRLQHANAVLRRSGEGTRVGNVALDCGFAHFGALGTLTGSASVRHPPQRWHSVGDGSAHVGCDEYQPGVVVDVQRDRRQQAVVALAQMPNTSEGGSVAAAQPTGCVGR